MTMHPQFIQLIEKNLEYWRRQVDQKTDTLQGSWIEHHLDILNAVTFGLRCKHLHIKTAQLLLNLFSIIVALRQEGMWLLAAEKLRVSEAIQADKSLHNQITRLAASLMRLSGQQDNASSLFLELLQEDISADQRGTVLFELGECRRFSNRLASARQYLLEARELFEQQALTQQVAATLNSLGIVETLLGTFDQAQAYLNEALFLEQRLGESGRAVRVLINLGRLHRFSKQPKQALNFYKLAREELSAESNVTDEVTILINIGTLYFDMQNYERAELFFLEARGYVQPHLKLRYFEGLIEMNLGATWQANGKNEEAIIATQAALQIWGELGDDLQMAQAHINLAESLEENLNYTAAKQSYVEAVVLLKGLPEHQTAIAMGEVCQSGLERLKAIGRN